MGHFYQYVFLKSLFEATDTGWQPYNGHDGFSEVLAHDYIVERRSRRSCANPRRRWILGWNVERGS